MLGVLAYFAAILLAKFLVFALHYVKGPLGDQLLPIVTGPGRFLIFVFLWKAWVELMGPSVALQQMMKGGCFSSLRLSGPLCAYAMSSSIN